MTRDVIARRARAIIARELLVLIGSVRDGADFRSDLRAGLTNMAKLRTALEGEFGVRFTAAEFAFCQTVGTAIDLVETKLENRSLVR